MSIVSVGIAVGEQHVVGADVGHEPQLDAEHLAVALGRQREVAVNVAPVRRGDERLAAVLDPLHREPSFFETTAATYSSG